MEGGTILGVREMVGGGGLQCRDVGREDIGDEGGGRWGGV